VVLGRGSEPHPHQLGGLGSAVSSPSGVRDGTEPGKIWILEHFGTSEIQLVERSDEYLCTCGAYRNDIEE